MGICGTGLDTHPGDLGFVVTAVGDGIAIGAARLDLAVARPIAKPTPAKTKMAPTAVGMAIRHPILRGHDIFASGWLFGDGSLMAPTMQSAA
jgi:hypothetical protein